MTQVTTSHNWLIFEFRGGLSNESQMRTSGTSETCFVAQFIDQSSHNLRGIVRQLGLKRASLDENRWFRLMNFRF